MTKNRSELTDADKQGDTSRFVSDVDDVKFVDEQEPDEKASTPKQ